MDLINLNDNDWIDVNDLREEADVDFDESVEEDELDMDVLMSFYEKKYGKQRIAK